MSADLSVPPGGWPTIGVRSTGRGETPAAPRARATMPPTHDAAQAAARDIQAADARRAIAAANEQLKRIDSELTFQLDNETGRVIVRLIDRNTREVLRQMPTKEALAIAQALAEDGPRSGRIVKANA